MCLFAPDEDLPRILVKNTILNAVYTFPYHGCNISKESIMYTETVSRIRKASVAFDRGWSDRDTTIKSKVRVYTACNPRNVGRTMKQLVIGGLFLIVMVTFQMVFMMDSDYPSDYL